MRKKLCLLASVWLVLSASADVVESLTLFDEAGDNTSMLQHANEFFRQLQEKFDDAPASFPETTPPDTLRQQVWYWAAEYYYDQQQYERSEEYGRKALPLFRLGSDRTGESDCLNILAIANVRLSDYEDAIDFAQQCYKLDEQSGDIERISASLNTLAAIYMSAYQPAEAEQYVLKGLQLATTAQNRPRKSVGLWMSSEVYHVMGDDQQALSYADEALALEQQLGREDRAMIRLSQKASALIGLHRYDEAERILSQPLLFFRDHGDHHSLALCYNKLGSIMLGRNRMTEAAPYYREAANIFHDIGDKTNEMHSRKGLYQSLWETRPDSAHLELERFIDLKDSLYTNTSARALARYYAEFGTDWLRQEKEAERSAKRNAILTAVIVVGVILLLSVMIWWLMRRRQRRQAEINQKLSANIDELREQYKELSVRYDKALITKGENNEKEELSEGDRDFMEKVVNSINAHMLKGQVDAESVASDMNMSLFQLRQRLTALTGETPQSFIAVIRMRRARYLLDNRPELNISEVAQLCAYNDTPNFTRAFKKTFGITPTKYVERQKTEQSDN